jgi:hypothetical protein
LELFLFESGVVPPVNGTPLTQLPQPQRVPAERHSPGPATPRRPVSRWKLRRLFRRLQATEGEA